MCAAESKLPKTRKGRKNLLLRNSSEYIRRMGSEDIDKLLLGLSKTKGLSVEDQERLEDGLYNVDYEYVQAARLRARLARAERLRY